MPNKPYDMSTSDPMVEVRDAAERVRSLVRRARFRDGVAIRTVRATPRATWVLLFLPGAFLIDALAPMPASARLCILIVSLAIVGWSLWALVSPCRRSQRTLMSYAVRLESASSESDGALTNTIQFAQDACERGGDDDITRALERRAVLRGASRVRESSDWSLPGSGSWKKRVAMFAVALSAIALLAAFAPRLVAMEANRFLDPMGPHPAWSATRFDVSVEPDEIWRGDDLKVHARLSGRTADMLELVLLDSQFQTVDRIAMHHVETSDADDLSRAFIATLRGVTDSVRFALETDEARSVVYELPVRPRLRLSSLRIVIEPPAYTGWETRSFSLGKNSAGATKALQGSRVSVALRGDAAIAGVDQKGLERVVVEGRDLLGVVDLLESGAREIALAPYGSDGGQLESPVELTIDVVRDQPPELFINAPAPPGTTVFLLEGATALASASGVDAIGLTAIGSELLPKPADQGGQQSGAASVDLRQTDEPRATYQRIIDPGSMNLVAGDSLELRFFAADGRPTRFGGPQRVETNPITIEIVDAQTMREEMAQRGMSLDHEELSAAGLCDAEQPAVSDEPCEICERAGATEPGESNDRSEGRSDGARFYGLEGEIEPSGIGDGAEGSGSQQGSGSGDVAIDGESSIMENPNIEEQTSSEVVLRVERDDESAVDVASDFQIDGVAGASFDVVPPSYRAMVSEYFIRVANQAAAPGDGWREDEVSNE